MRRAAFVAGCVTAAAAGVMVGVTDWLLKRAIRETSWGTAETAGHPIDEPHHIDLTDAYEAHSTPHVEMGHRDGLVWVPLAGSVWVWPN